MSEEKVRENRLRRMADRQGLVLVKNRRRDPKAVGFGTYTLTSAVADEAGPATGPGMTLDQVEQELMK